MSDSANPCADITGIKAVDFALCQEVEIEAKIEKSEPLLDRHGKFVKIETYGPTNDFSLRGKGDLPDGVLAGHSIPIRGLEQGQTFVTNDRVTQKGGEWFDWTASGTNFPDAQAPGSTPPPSPAPTPPTT